MNPNVDTTSEAMVLTCSVQSLRLDDVNYVARWNSGAVIDSSGVQDNPETWTDVLITWFKDNMPYSLLLPIVVLVGLPMIVALVSGLFPQFISAIIKFFSFIISSFVKLLFAIITIPIKLINSLLKDKNRSSNNRRRWLLLIKIRKI